MAGVSPSDGGAHEAIVARMSIGGVGEALEMAL